MALRPMIALLALPLLGLGCGDDKKADTQAAKADKKYDQKAEPVEPTTTGAEKAEATGVAEAFEEDWGDIEAEDLLDTDGGDTGELPAADARYVGPCYIVWTSGTVVRFKYDDDGSGGRVRIDRDGDKKSDVCGRFEVEGDKTTHVEIDEDCDGKTDVDIRPEYDEEANIATAKYEQREGETSESITLITLPTFSGMVPGYPLQAAREDIKLKIRKGLVRNAHVPKPTSGQPTKVSLRYDKEGRVTRLEEDLEADGTVDRRFDYKYDDVGNVTRVNFRFGTGDEATKGWARPSYKCWADDKGPVDGGEDGGL